MARRKNRAIANHQRMLTNDSKMAYPIRQPFWLPATSYYFLAVAVASIFFFLIWGILNEGGDETPWIPAGIFASLILIGAVFLREIFLRNARNEYLIAKRQLDRNLRKLPKKVRNKTKREKFTLQQNSYMLKQIKEKSDAARVLKRLPEGHLEVFEICNEYLNFTRRELKWIDKNSPRHSAVRKGRKKVKRAHKYHLLKWAEVESKRLSLEAKSKGTVVEKVESAQKAKSVVDSALSYYPTDKNLTQSLDAIREFISTLKISNLIEQAEKTAFEGNRQEALDLFGDILFLITRENIKSDDKEFLTAKVENEILQIKNK